MKKILIKALALIFINSSFAYADLNLSDSWIGEPFSGLKQSKSAGKNYMVSTANEQASQAAQSIINQGGNAIDAAIAAQLVLNVVEPHSSGIGGGGFLLYFDAKNDKSIYFNGRETSPTLSYETMFFKNGKVREFSDAVKGGLSVGTPGLLKALKDAHQSYGNLPWEKLFEPAIKIANEGFKVDDRMHILSKEISYLKDFNESAEIYLDKDKNPLKVGDVIKNPKMAQTLQIIAKEGIKPFYEGKIAKDIVKAVRTSKINPGLLSQSDLRNYQVKKGDLICATYRVKYKVCSMPLPSSGGITLLQILGILENFDLSKMQANSSDTIHLITEATRLAYADRNEYIADSDNVPFAQMLDKVYLRDRAKLIREDKTLKDIIAGSFSKNNTQIKKPRPIIANNVEKPSTTHISIIDKNGNAVALTSSIEYFFGSGLSVDGFMLNNQMTDFSLTPSINGKKVANRIQPNKQPRSSMSPTFVFDANDKLLMVVGSPGGPRIIQFTLKTILNHIDFGMNVQDAISSPNFVVLNNEIELESNTGLVRIQKKLESLGHKVKITDITSGINAITVNDNKLSGAADPRRQGKAIGE